MKKNSKNKILDILVQVLFASLFAQAQQDMHSLSLLKGPFISRDHELSEQLQLLRLLLAKSNRRLKIGTKQVSLFFTHKMVFIKKKNPWSLILSRPVRRRKLLVGGCWLLGFVTTVLLKSCHYTFLSTKARAASRSCDIL